jgi:hypothetical protein
MLKHHPRGSQRRLALAALAALASVHACRAAIAAQPAEFGTPARPFAADSLWNARPFEPVFGQYEIPESRFVPAVGGGPFSTGVFVSDTDDTPVEVGGQNGKAGVDEPNTGTQRVITIPHWPAGVIAAKGSDGHADIIDPAAGVIHSFWQLKQQDGRWTAALYAWSRLNGRGWGDPAHFYQGARATGVPTSAGIIRSHEVNDGAPLYRHALALSLTYNALAREPAYVFPATAADNNAAATNSGQIPQGALLMLPPSFDAARIANPALRKVAETLKQYGAYVVDRNDGTPFYIYAENGSGLNLHPKGWDQNVANELQRIRAGLRQVVSATGWIDGNDRTFTPSTRINLLTMQGLWRGADAAGRYDARTDMLVFPASAQAPRMVSLGVLDPARVRWAATAPGQTCRLTVRASGGARLRLQLRSKDYARMLFDSGELEDGASQLLACPAAGVRTEMQAIGSAGQGSSVRAELAAEPAGTS